MITLPVHLRVGGTEAEVGTVTTDAPAELPHAVAELLRTAAEQLAAGPGEEAPT
ncbi:hypothetical protein [Streptomyces sp. FIT100]|uniref:hypothetical protein n=1 Tax=Streptomyces sp. FIT100 TaxID=2837956 RepID=UPI0021C5B5AC|nr:hypothetical protein [Streptomyces sp. FIT100]UUN29437.1 hypothetical protein KK483_25955 [Streptomyces sp. FIT100]